MHPFYCVLLCFIPISAWFPFHSSCDRSIWGYWKRLRTGGEYIVAVQFYAHWLENCFIVSWPGEGWMWSSWVALRTNCRKWLMRSVSCLSVNVSLIFILFALTPHIFTPHILTSPHPHTPHPHIPTPSHPTSSHPHTLTSPHIHSPMCRGEVQPWSPHYSCWLLRWSWDLPKNSGKSSRPWYWDSWWGHHWLSSPWLLNHLVKRAHTLTQRYTMTVLCPDVC